MTDKNKLKFIKQILDCFQVCKNECFHAFCVIKLNNNRISAVANNPRSTGYALAFLLMPHVINAFLLFFSWKPFDYYFYIFVLDVLLPAGLFIASIYIFHLIVTKLFKARGSFIRLFRVLGYASILNFIYLFIGFGFIFHSFAFFQSFSFLRIIVHIWLLIISFRIIKKFYGTDDGTTITALILYIIAIAILSNLLTFLPIGFHPES